MTKQNLARLRIVGAALLLSMAILTPIFEDSINHQETAYASPANVDPTCPSLEWARANLHSDVVLKGESRCAYHMARNDGKYEATVTYKKGWIVDAAEPDEHVYVQIGDDTQHVVKAATWWQCEKENCTERALRIACAGMHEFASLPQNNFDSVVVCRGMAEVAPSSTSPLASVPEPQINTASAVQGSNAGATEILTKGTFNGVQLDKIDGGWKYIGAVYEGPAPCKVYYGYPEAKWYNPGDPIKASVMSIYGCN